MRAGQVKRFLVNLYKAEEKERRRTPVLLLGGPGIGKTTAIEEAAENLAESMKLELVDYSDMRADEILTDPSRYFVFHSLPLVGVEPTDLTGHPRLHDSQVRYYPLAWSVVMSRCRGILFLDDFLDTQRLDVMSAAYRIFLERRIGYTYLSQGVMVVAASNTPEYSTLSQLMPAPLANRACIIEVDPPSVREWAEWMHEHHDEWDRRVYVFLEKFGEEYLFRPPKESETLSEFGSPRSWTKLAVLMPKGVDGTEVMKGIVGEELAQKFRAFCEIDIDLEELARDPSRFVTLSEDAKYMACLMIANSLEKEKSLAKYTDLLKAITHYGREWAVITVLSMRKPKRDRIMVQLLKTAPEFIQAIDRSLWDRNHILS